MSPDRGLVMLTEPYQFPSAAEEHAKQLRNMMTLAEKKKEWARRGRYVEEARRQLQSFGAAFVAFSDDELEYESNGAWVPVKIFIPDRGLNESKEGTKSHQPMPKW